MSLKKRLRAFYFSRLSSPPADRLIYQAISRSRARRIVEIGLGTGDRTRRMIEVAAAYAPPAEICYTGIDLFESRTSLHGPGMPLKLAHRVLKPTGATIRLVPGDALSALSRVANTLTGTDVLVISGWHDTESLARAWFFIPRMLVGHTAVFMEDASGSDDAVVFNRMARGEIERLADAASERRAA